MRAPDGMEVGDTIIIRVISTAPFVLGNVTVGKEYEGVIRESIWAGGIRHLFVHLLCDDKGRNYFLNTDDDVVAEVLHIIPKRADDVFDAYDRAMGILG